MKYTLAIDLELPRERVLELFDDPNNHYKWLKGLVSFEPISGDPGQVGAKSKYVFKMGKRDMEMVETITKRDLPNEFSGTYDAKNVHNLVINRFTELSPTRTRWETENVFELKGFMKIIGLIFRGSFPKQSLAHMNDFKAFAEEGRDVRDASA